MDACGPRWVAPISGVVLFRSIQLCKNLARLKSIEPSGLSWRICLPSFDFANDAFCHTAAGGGKPAATWASGVSARVISYPWTGASCDVVSSISVRTANGIFRECAASAAPPPASLAAASLREEITMNVSGSSLSKVALRAISPRFLQDPPVKIKHFFSGQCRQFYRTGLGRRRYHRYGP